MSSQQGSASALASLTATYTDSEDEIEDMEEDDTANVQIIEISSAANSPQAENSSDQSLHSSAVEESQKLSTAQSLGLVSYQDDLIDDEAVDDMYTSEASDSNTQEEALEDDELAKAENQSLQRNGDNPEQISIDKEEEDILSPKKKSRIPPEPPGKCAAELQEKISKLYARKLRGGLDMNLAIQRNKNFRNPSIYEKLIKYCDIDELGSNYPLAVFDPHEWHSSSYYDKLAEAQKEHMEKRERDRKERTKVDFVSGTVKKPGPLMQDTEPKRKSKWDQRGVSGVMPPLLLSSSYTQPQPPVALPPFTTSASGTKSTVISAFGSMNKKQRN